LSTVVIQQTQTPWYKSQTNTKENVKTLLGSASQHVLATIGDKIHAIDPRNYDGEIPNKHLYQSELYDLKIGKQKIDLIVDGQLTEASKLNPTLTLGHDLIEDSKRQKKRMDRDNAGRLIKPYGAAGNVIDTPYEVARQLKYLLDVSGKQYKLKIFQARNTVKIVSSGSDLHLTGFIKTGELLQGTPELSDYQTPDPSRQAFDTYQKAIFADSFHWQSTMRERSNSGPNIEAEMSREIPGIMESMVDIKIRAALNLLPVEPAVGSWRALEANGHFTEEADQDVQDAGLAIDEFDGQFVFYAHRTTISAYLKNIMGRNFTGIKTLTPETERSGTTPLNEDLQYFIGNQLEKGQYFVLARDHAIEMHQGPQLDIMYKNEKTPGQLIGRMKFNYNGIITKFEEAAGSFTGAVPP